MKDVVGLVRHWDVGIPSDVTVIGEQSGVTLLVAGDGRRLVLKRKAGTLDVALEVNLLTHLAARDLPVAAPLPATDGTYLVLWEEAGYCLYPYLPGQVYDQHYNQDDGVDAVVLARVSAYGRGLARLHQGLALLPEIHDYPVMELQVQLREWVWATLADAAPGVCDLTQVYERFETWLFARYGELPQQAIHRDAHPGKVSGFIDFEIATRGPRIFDLAYCSTALLAAAEGISARRQAWLALVTALVQGYVGVQELTEAERALLGQVQMAIQLIFAAYYTDVGMPAQMVSNLESLQWLVANRDAVSATIRAVGRQASV